MAGRSLLLAGYYGHGNAGDEAILEATLAELPRWLPGARITVAAGDAAEIARRHGVAAVSSEDLAALAAAVAACDAVILGGGGLFQDYWPAPLSRCLASDRGGLPAYLTYPVLAAAAGKPCFLFAAGVGPLRTEQGRRQTALAFALAAGATVRDPASRALVESLEETAERLPEVAADPAWLLTPDEAAAAEVLRGLRVEAEEPLFGLALRDWRFGAPLEHNEAAIALALDAFLASRPHTLLMLPFSCAAELNDDRVVHRRVASQLRRPVRVVSLEEALPPRTLAALLARCDLALAMRYHAALFALAAGVPTVGLAYDPKLTALFSAADCSSLALPPGDWRAGGLAAALELAASVDLRGRLAGLSARESASARRSFALLARTVREPRPLATAARALAELAVGAALGDSWQASPGTEEVRQPTARPLAESPAPPPGLPREFDLWAGAAEATSRSPVLILSGTRLSRLEGQRPSQLALELAERGHPVLFASFRWPGERASAAIPPAQPNLFEVPLDAVAAEPSRVASALAGRERVALFEFPYPPLVELLAALNGCGWVTLYDLIDDWRAFADAGAAHWFDAPFERHLAAGVDAALAVSAPLLLRLGRLGRPGAALVGNALRPEIAPAEPAAPPLADARSPRLAGYFGYLSPAWFDWELLAAAARARPDWRFELIGYGVDAAALDLPANVALLGRKPPAELAGIAARWRAAMVPFREGEVAAAADPIKTYEYLALGLPVVVTGVAPPPGAEGLVARAYGVDAFVAALEASSNESQERAARRAWALGQTWRHRVDALLEIVASGAQRIAEKRAWSARGDA